MRFIEQLHPGRKCLEPRRLGSRGVLTLSIAICASALPALAQNLIANGTYTITNKFTGQVADVKGASTANGVVIDEWDSNSGTNQHFVLTNLGSNYVSLINVNSGLAIEVYNWSKANGATIDQWTYSGGQNQVWKVVSEGSGSYELVNEYSGLALEVPAYNESQGTALDQYTVNGGANQLWTFTGTSGGGTTINGKLGKPNRVLIGLGAYNAISDMNAQGIKPDIIDTYLPWNSGGSWTNYSSPSGSYVTNTANAANAIGAIPMYTLYQMADLGDGNLSGISQSSFMSTYWSQARLMFQKLGSYGHPTLVNLEPDFWGYVELDATNHDPTQMYAVVSTQSECSSLPNTAAGIAACLLKLGRTYAPNALIGFPASFFGESAPTVAAFMTKVGAQNADFIVAQTSDRDAGCEEVSAPPPECSGRGSGPFYWDENNVNSPNFEQSISTWSTYRSDLPNGLPIIWWQTPLGVPSSSRGGYTNHYRDDHVDYMLKNAYQYGNIDTFGIVFSGGASSQTSITTDNGEFATLLKQYLSTGGAGVN
jgi:hypothetical protein